MVEKVSSLPKGWDITIGAVNPKGYKYISNRESRFSGKRKIALLKSKII